MAKALAKVNFIVGVGVFWHDYDRVNVPVFDVLFICIKRTFNFKVKHRFEKKKHSDNSSLFEIDLKA